MKKISLKPCPFCGNEVVELTNAKVTEECINFEDEECPECFEQSSCSLYCVVCSVNKGGCGASSGYHTTKGRAIEAWNRRANDDTD